MATNLASPGVYTIEQDNSQFAPSLTSNVVGLVGFATKGPTNKATLITSPQRLVDMFGSPDESLDGQGLLAALEILETTDALYYVRAVVDASAYNASAAVKIGACPHVLFSAMGLGVTGNLYLKTQVYDNNGIAKFPTTKTFSIPSGTDTNQASALTKVIGAGSLENSYLGVVPRNTTSESTFLFGSFAGSAALLGVSAYTDSGFTIGLSCIQVPFPDGTVPATTLYSSVLASGVTYNYDPTNASSFIYQVYSLYPGAGYNAGTNTDGTTSGNSVEVINLNGQYFTVQVNDKGRLREQFRTRLMGSGTFIEDAINTNNVDNLTSEVIYGYIYGGNQNIPANRNSLFTDSFATLGLSTTNILGRGMGTSTASATHTQELKVVSRFFKCIPGVYGLSAGTNGVGTSTEDAAALIGDNTVTPKTGMQALDRDDLNISIAAVPGITDQNVQNALINIAESTNNFLAVVSPPYAIGNVQQAIDWSNGYTSTRTAAINSSWAAVYWPWVKVFDKYTKKDRWYDPATFAVRQMTFTDAVAEAWFAPAGQTRGRLTKPTDVEVQLNQGDRNSLYGQGNIINPIVNFPQQGIMIWGQRTGQRTSSAVDRVNVRRLMIFLRKSFLAAGRPVVFEPNDAFTWAKVKTIIEPLLDDIKRRRGISAYQVVCDETVNTPQRIANNQLWCKVLIKPTLTAEVLVFELNLTSQSTPL